MWGLKYRVLRKMLCGARPYKKPSPERCKRSISRSPGLAETGLETRQRCRLRDGGPGRRTCARGAVAERHRGARITAGITMSTGDASGRSSCAMARGKPPTMAELTRLFRANTKALWGERPGGRSDHLACPRVRSGFRRRLPARRHQPGGGRAGRREQLALGVAAIRPRPRRRSRLAARPRRGEKAPGPDRRDARGLRL